MKTIFGVETVVVTEQDTDCGLPVELLAEVGQVCGAVSEINLISQCGRVYVVKVLPRGKIDPILPLVVDAGTKLHAILREYYQTLVLYIDAIDRDFYKSIAYHKKLLDLVPTLTETADLTPYEKQYFRQNLFAGLAGMPTGKR